MPLCAWTLQESDRAIPVDVDSVDGLGRYRGPVRTYVLPEHEAALRQYAARARRAGRFFLGGVIALTLAIVGAAIAGSMGVITEAGSLRATGILLASLGALLWALPFTTPQTAQAFGVAQSVRIARTLAAVTVVLGLILAVRA